MRNNLSLINVYKNKSTKSNIVTQLIYGDTFKVLKKSGDWIKIKNDYDHYKGFIKKRKFPINQKNTHKVYSLYADLYSEPKNKSKIKKKLTFASKIKVLEKNKIFYRFDNLWIKKKDLKQINYKEKEIFKNIKIFLNRKYKWGGKHFSGVDCSGLLQLFFYFNNKFCPRDTKDQIKYFKNKVRLNKIKKNDLIFWRGHVALVISKKKLLHAYGPFKKTVIMPINKTIDRIQRTANLKVTGIRRI